MERMRKASILATSLLTTIVTVARVSAADDPHAAFKSVQQRIEGQIKPAYHAALLEDPRSAEALRFLDQVRGVVDELRALPQPPAVPPIFAADAHRMLAFLHLAEAGILQLRKLPEFAAQGVSPDNERVILAEKALRECELSTNWLWKIERPGSGELTPELGRAIERSEIKAYLSLYQCTAHAILWDVKQLEHDRKAAIEAWNRVPVAMRSRPPPPEVVKAVGLNPDPDPKDTMTMISWSGIGLVVLGVGIAIVRREATVFQQWAVRVLIALGAAMAATVVPGLLNIKVPGYVAAGGALAVIVLVYLLNPPALPKDTPDAGRSRANRRRSTRNDLAEPPPTGI